MAQNSQQGGFGEFGGFTREVSISQIANADRIRYEQDSFRKHTTRRRQGNKGERRWGFMEPGTGKRR